MNHKTRSRFTQILLTKLPFHFFSDAPGPARLQYSPSQVVKGQALTMHCIVEELGRPIAPVYRWMRGTYNQTEVRSDKWTINPVSLETRSNFSCQAVNEAGFGIPAYQTIDVHGKAIMYNMSCRVFFDHG